MPCQYLLPFPMHLHNEGLFLTFSRQTYCWCREPVTFWAENFQRRSRIKSKVNMTLWNSTVVGGQRCESALEHSQWPWSPQARFVFCGYKMSHDSAVDRHAHFDYFTPMFLDCVDKALTVVDLKLKLEADPHIKDECPKWASYSPITS